VKRERLTRLLELQDGITQEMSQAYQGKVVEVLFHDWRNGVLEGRTRTNKIVTVPGGREHLGTIKRVKIGETRMYQLLGTLAEGGDTL
jgi:tRNA-2-methylthio-N6-dimethylallyladenosine synthase